MKIIGLAGTNGSGKDTVAKIIKDAFGYDFVSASDLLREECQKRGLPVERHNLRQISAEWRASGGLGVLIDKSIEIHGQDKSKNLIIASLRNIGEANRVHELNGKVIWVDANPLVRYNRINLRNRSIEDRKTFEEFVDEENIEMKGYSKDPTTLNTSAVREVADISLVNNGNDLKLFEKEVVAKLKDIV